MARNRVAPINQRRMLVGSEAKMHAGADHRADQILAFPHDGRLWRVHLFGELDRNDAAPSEPLVEVILSPTSTDAAAAGRQPVQLRSCWMSAGYLGFVRIGSLWRNGIRVDAERSQGEFQARFERLRISPETMRIVSGNTSQVADGVTRYLIPPAAYKLGAEGIQTRFLAIDHDGIENHILIPTIEVGRFYYFNSSALTRHIVWGRLQVDRNSVFNPTESPLAPDGVGMVKLRRDIPDSDAWIVSRLAHSPLALKHSRNIHGSLSVRRANGQRLYPDIYPPFQGDTTLVVYGRWFHSLGAKRFLVFWISSCSHPFPATRLGITSDRDGRSDGIFDESRPEAFPGIIRRDPDATEAETGLVLRSDSEPRRDMAPLTVLLSNARFPDLLCKATFKPPKLSCQYRAIESPTVAPIDNLSGYASGEGDLRDRDAAPIAVNDSLQANHSTPGSAPSRRLAHPPSLEAVRQALEHLQSLGDIHLRFLGSANGMRDFTRQAYCWTVIQDRARQVLIGEIELQDSYFYVFEAERRKSEALTTLFIHHPMLHVLPEQIVEDILYRCVCNRGTWLKTSELAGFPRHKFKHTWSSPSQFSNSLLQKMGAEIRRPIGDRQPLDPSGEI